MKTGNALKLTASIIICELIGILGAIFTMPAVKSWYMEINKPSFNPPNWIFGPAWTTLYLLMGIAFFLIWEKGLKNSKVKNAAVVFIIQLIVNFLWSVIFFGGRSYFGGLITIVILWLLILANIIMFYRISKPAGLILIPYILWVSFASILNYYIFILNK
ncbi:MAG: TspO protein [Candidatus Firestonebacteria bacterium RIFOXYC2_FULL_39_67]|nr:MAG: TspO protein [Candidatus Firestonebacteria bacterium RIFOXYD2_FULL_39_29]OGF52959.1 MAG: TspO protein [Candidatus Firestonebacteria bacterium RifOxyC12_full_39_7]OGF55511.1 MAG: TspO protein [Candidatus Firestonebacteria bacterium RIFOXYC2_FULL_39_67]